MSHTKFTLEDFEDDASFGRAVSTQQKGQIQIVGTSGSLSADGPNLNMTTLGMSDIMQGRALWKPKETNDARMYQLIASDLSGLLKAENKRAEDTIGMGASFLPFDIMLRKTYTDNYYAAGVSSSPAGGNGDSTYTLATGDAAAFISRAAAEIGYTEEGNNMNKFAAEAGHANGQAWCGTFVVAIARRVGLKLPSESAYTPTMAQGFRDAGQFFDKDARPGDIVFFDFPNDNKTRIQHVGIVESVSPVNVITIEGNTSAGRGSQDNGGAVARKTRDYASIVGFGRTYAQ